MYNNITFFPAIVACTLLGLGFSELLSSLLVIDGEFVYTCGFIIILYLIWREFYQVADTIKPQFGYSDLSSFWYKYRDLEYSVLLLCQFKIILLNVMLHVFTYTSSLSRILNRSKIDFITYKTFIQVLNKVKQKTKALPLQ